MHYESPALSQRSRVQFSLRTMFAAVTLVSVLLGVWCWIGSSDISGAIFSATGILQIGVTFWPVVIVVLWRNDAGAKVYGWCVFTLAMLFFAHLWATIFHVQVLRGEPAGFDPAVCRDILAGTLNWTVPSVAVGLVVALYLALTARTTLPYLAGCLLATIGVVGFFWLAQVFLCPWPGALRFVWWM